MTFALLSPTGQPIPGAPGTTMVEAAWNASEHDERLARLLRPERRNNVAVVKKAGYRFIEEEAQGA